MPRQIVDRNTTWLLDQSDQTWTLTENAKVDVRGTNDGTGIEDVTFGSTIQVLGSVFASNVGVVLGSSSSSLTIGEDAWIFSTTGIDMHAGSSVINHGSVSASQFGIESAGGRIENSGTINATFDAVHATQDRIFLRNVGQLYGDRGVSTFEGGRIVNGEEGEITGLISAISPWNGHCQIINHGILRGGQDAIHASIGPLEVRNTGKIFGDVWLGNGESVIDTRGGIIRGVIHGGASDDTYVISSSNIRIDDEGPSFGDLVRSSASFVLGGGLDDLQMLGRRNINGTGNGGDNEIIGNSGNNSLAGGSGDDMLSGGAGNDRLMGAGDEDVFIFNRGFDQDRIQDFANGVDKIVSNFVTTQGQFDRLDVRQVGDQLVIDFGRGDRLTLENFSRGDFDFGDFLVL